MMIDSLSNNTTNCSSHAKRATMIIIVLLSIAIIINIIQFRAIESALNNRYKAINQEPSSCILEFGLGASPLNKQLYGMPVELAKLKHGLTIITPQDDHYAMHEFVNRILGFGRVAEIKQMDYDASTFLLDFDYHPFIAASGEGGDRGDPFVIAYKKHPLKPPDPNSFIVLRRNSTDVLVDIDLLPEGALEGIE